MKLRIIYVFLTGLLSFTSLISFAQMPVQTVSNTSASNPEQLFLHPPESAKPGVLWMWMGANISSTGITKDLQALKEEGFNSTTVISLADITDPWGVPIGKDPTPDIIAWTDPWWKMVQHAATESKRLNMTMGLFDGAGYSTSGGTWITPELSMQQLCWSQTIISGNGKVQGISLNKPAVDPHANARFPTYNPKIGKTEIPEIEERKTYYKDIAVLAMPSKDTVLKSSVINITALMQPDGSLHWQVPEGEWTIYRFGHTVLGERGQPAQWQATGFECDKMSKEAVSFHLDHVINEMKKHLGSLVGHTVDHVYFDSYEDNDATWTPKMREDFLARRGYDLLPYLATFAGRTIEGIQQTATFKTDFTKTVEDLYRDIYFTTIAEKLKAADLKFYCEPYGGPWKVDEVVPLVSNVMGEFWTNDGVYSPYELDGLIKPLRNSNKNIFAAEAFTGQPAYSKWNETPAWQKPIGDEAFCVGVNKLIIHRFTEQPWDDKYKPGAAMGQWGTHFDRTQTWWKPAKAMVFYLQRCSALLQWGHYVPASLEDFGLELSNSNMVVKEIHRRNNNTDIYFVANTSHYPGKANCSFNIKDKQPELWDPVTGNIRNLNVFAEKDGKATIPIDFDDAQSFFIVFRNKITVHAAATTDFAISKPIMLLDSNWQVTFDSAWGGPPKPVQFETLTDWTTNNDDGIKYYSGTAIYSKTFTIPGTVLMHKQQKLFLNLGKVNCIARVFINDVDAGVVWTAPWKINIPVSLLKPVNKLKIEVTNVWSNRLIGDEQQPPDMEWLPNEYFYNSGQYLKEFPAWFLNHQTRPSKKRYCFTTWNYFDSHSALSPSGLLGPVQLEYDNF